MVLGLIAFCFTHACTIGPYIYFLFSKLKWMYYTNNRCKENETQYRYTKTVFAKIPKQDLTVSKQKRLVQELEVIDMSEPLFTDLSKLKLMDMSEPFPHNANFYYFILDLVLPYILYKVNQLFQSELESELVSELELVSEDDMIYVPIRVDSELFSDEDLIQTCNFYEYDNIPLDKRNTIFQNIWMDCRKKYRDSIFCGETMGLYTAEVESLQLVFLLVTDCLQVELKSNAKWETIPIVVNTYGTTLEEILDNLSVFPWIIHYKNKRWQIVSAGTRPVSY